MRLYFLEDPETIDFKKFQRNTKVSKWDKDVIIKAFGNTNAFNMLELEKVVDYLASLGLPINIELTKSDNYNVELYFGRKKDIEKKTGRKIKYLIAGGGFGDIIMDSLNVVKNAFVGIDNRIDTTTTNRKNTTIEELTQTLGIFGDSYSHINSTFYQSNKKFKYQDQLFDIDYKVLKLLYSTDIKVGLSINEFYKAFEDVIPNTKLNYAKYMEFDRFVQKQKFSPKTIQLFCLKAFSMANYIIKEDHIQKWNNDISFMLADSFSKSDSLLIYECINTFSKYFDKPKLKPREGESFNANILIKYHEKEFLHYCTRAMGADMLNYQIYKANLFTAKSIKIPDALKKKMTYLDLLLSLGLNNPTATIELPETYIFGEFDEDNPELFSKYDKELFTLFFHPSLKSGMTKTKILRILRKYYPIDEFLDRKEFKK